MPPCSPARPPPRIAGEFTQLTNLTAVLPDSRPHLAGENLVISARYDHPGLGDILIL